MRERSVLVVAAVATERRLLQPTFRRLLPVLLAAERGAVQVAGESTQRLDAAPLCRVRQEHLVATSQVYRDTGDLAVVV